MAVNFEGGKNTTGASKEEMSQEKRDKTSTEKIKDFEQLSPEEKAAEIDGAMLDSENLLKRVKGVEIEALGGRDAVEEKAGWFGKIKIKFADHFGSDESHFESIAKVARKATDRDIDNISKNIGQELLTREADLAKHKSNADNDLKILAGLGLHSENQLKDISVKLETEREDNRQMVENLKQELADRTAGYRESAIEKSRELLGFINEYKGVYDSLKQEKRQLAGKVSKFEQALKSFKVEGDMDYKSEVEEELLNLKNDLQNIEQAEAELKVRLYLVGTNKREVDTFLDRIDKIGSTDKEFRQKKLERKRVIESGGEERNRLNDTERKQARMEAEQKQEEVKTQGKNETKEKVIEEEIAGFGREETASSKKEKTRKENKAGEGEPIIGLTDVTVEEKERILVKSVDEWVKAFCQEREFARLYNRPKKGNTETKIEEALRNHFNEGGKMLSGEVDEETATKYLVNFLKKRTTAYKGKPDKALEEVNKIMKKLKENN